MTFGRDLRLCPFTWQPAGSIEIVTPEHSIAWERGRWVITLLVPDGAGIMDPTVTTIQPDETAGKDTLIYYPSPNNNYGLATTIQVGVSAATQVLRGLIQPSIAGLPADQVIEGAYLSLYCTVEASTTDYDVTAYKMLVSWFEGAQSAGAPGAADGSTWNHRNANTGGQVTWGAAGCQSGVDYYATPSGSVTVPNTGQYYNIYVTDDVAAGYADPGSYNGWILLGDETTTSTRRNFASSSGSAAQRPKLVVTHSDVPVSTRRRVWAAFY
jgi:hypothetical protein